MKDDRIPAAVEVSSTAPNAVDELLSSSEEGSTPKSKRSRKHRQEAQAQRNTVIKTYQCKVRDCSKAWLDQAAREVNDVWNYCNALTRETSHGNGVRARRWWSEFDMNGMLSGCGPLFERIGADIAQCVSAEHAIRRKQFNKAYLRFRHSGGRKKSLGWIPFKVANLRFKTPQGCEVEPALDETGCSLALVENSSHQGRAKSTSPSRSKAKSKAKYKHRVHKGNTFQAAPGRFKLTFMGKTIRLFNEAYLFDAVRHAQATGGKIGQGSFSQDALGDWYLNVPIETPRLLTEPSLGPESSVGLDPGYKSAMTASDGTVLRSRRYREMEARIQQAQRRGHKKQAKRLHRQARRYRQEDRNQFCRRLVDSYARIYVGDVQVKTLIKRGLSGHAKSIHDAGIGACKQTLIAMGHRAGRVVEIVSERYSTRRCHGCGALSGPRGLGGAVVRSWECSACGALHDRDRNSAENIRQHGEARRIAALLHSAPVSRPGVDVRLREHDSSGSKPVGELTYMERLGSDRKS